MSENNKEEKKMTIYDYENKYVKRENTKGVKFFLNLFIVLIGIMVFTCLFLIVEKVYNINKYAGYGAAGIGLIIFIVFYIVPITKVMRSEYFITNVNRKHALAAKAHNKKTRRNIAAKMVDFDKSVDGAGWYDSSIILELECALSQNDDKKLKESLTKLYDTSVKTTAKQIITNESLKAGLYSALSQNGALDASLIAFCNLRMIKDLVFLYGFRPSEAKLMKIYAGVLTATLAAYGVSNVGGKIGNTISSAAKTIPVLGAIIGTVVDSAVQGAVNSTLTCIIGYQTLKYINQEYHMQDVLDGVEIEESEEEVQASIKEIESELKDNIKSKAKPAKAA